MSNYPYAVCTKCDWEQFYHRGDERGTVMWGNIHKSETGHTTRTKHHHEFADVLWTQTFITESYGESAVQMWLETLNDSVRSLIAEYTAGLYSVEECERLYAVFC
jgi:hypothetical protein